METKLEKRRRQSREASQRWRDSGKATPSVKRWREANPERQLLIAARSRAKARGLAFDLELSDVVIPDVCPVLGTPMVSPSLDRKNNDLGYIKGNVVVMSRRANCLKNDATVEEMRLILAYMEN
jgi:hypothetical protein